MTLFEIYKKDPGCFNVPPQLILNMQNDSAILSFGEAFPERAVYVCGPLNCIHETTEDFNTAFVTFFRTFAPIWDRLGKTLEYKYDAIANYDRTEEATEKISDDASRASSSTGGSSVSSSDTLSRVNAEKVSGYDSEKMVDKSSVSDTGSAESSGTTSNRAENRELSASEKEIVKKFRAYGNIGVTTTQEMIQAERAVSRYSLIDEMVNNFKAEFMTLLY